MLSKQDRIEHHMTVLGASLEMAQSSYIMLLDLLATPQVEMVERTLVPSDDPAKCEHPNQITLDVNPPHLMCDDCGLDLGPQYINGG